MEMGASGTVTGVTDAPGVENVLVPASLIAATWKKYGVPLANPVTVHETAVPIAGQPAASAKGPLRLVATCTW
jgi:hypothetical protein